ncbi:MAG: radical SAM protein, partial [Pseudomonadota bacterium]
MKIALVFPPFYLEAMYNLPPLGLVNLATSLKGAPHKVVLIDFVLAIRKKSLKMGNNIYEDCAERILGESPHMVGFSAQCTTFPGIMQISEKIRDKDPDVKIVLGGHNAGFVDLLTLEKYPFIDAIVRGEGERTFQELVAAYESGKDGEGIQGVTYRRGASVIRNEDRDLIINLDELPLPDYHFLPSFHEYRDACRIPRSIAILEVGRGCPHRCIYCSESLMWRRIARNFSVSRLVKEMANLHENFGAECFLLAYDQFTARRRFVEEFCHKVIDEGLNRLPWYCISRLDSLDAGLLALMREAGCESMCFGVDSGSKRTLSFIRKNIDQEILYQRIKETSAQGIIPTLSFVIGFPEEEKEDIDETLALALRAGIVGNNNPLIQMPTVLPGTELHSSYQGRLVRRLDTYFALGTEFDQGRRLKSDEDIIDSDAVLFSSFYNLPCPGRPLEELNLIATYFPLIVRFYPKSFLLLSLERGETISDLFIRFLHWLDRLLERKAPSLTPKDCYLHFRDFVLEMRIKEGEMVRKHLPDVLKYENLSLEAGKFR